MTSSGSRGWGGGLASALLIELYSPHLLRQRPVMIGATSKSSGSEIPGLVVPLRPGRWLVVRGGLGDKRHFGLIPQWLSNASQWGRKSYWTLHPAYIIKQLN